MTSTNPSTDTPIGQPKRHWVNDPNRRCTAHKRDGSPCGNPAIRGGSVCTHHGGRAPAVKAKARRRLEEASDRLARQLLGIAEGAESEAVRLAAVKDALDRAGVQAKTAATVEVSVKPWETVLEGISKVVAGPRNPQQRALESSSPESSSPDAALEGEVIGPDDPDPSRGLEILDPLSDSDPTTNAQQLADNHERRSGGGVTPPDDSASLSVDAGPPDEYQESALGGPLGPRGPMGNGMLSLQDAVEAAAQMKAEHAARLRAEMLARRSDYQARRDEARRY